MTDPHAPFLAAILPRLVCAAVLSLTWVIPPRDDAVARAAVAGLLLCSLVLGVVRLEKWP